MDITDTLAPNSDQIGAEDFLPGPRTVTITGVSKGSAEQPVNIELEEFPGRPYRPCKSMRRVLVAAWGSDASTYIGRRLTLFNDPTVKWGGVAVGGVRIKALSHIDKTLTLPLTTTRGKRTPFTVEPLPDAPAVDVPGFQSRIAEATTTTELDTIAKDLKAQNLGQHRKLLQDAWSNRRKDLEDGIE